MISVAKENFKSGGTFRITNPDDPTERVLPGEKLRFRRRGELEDLIVNEGGGQKGGVYGGIHLSSEQLATIERAKEKAGVK